LGGNSITPLTSFTETDPTVPSWAKAASKPTYTAAEVNAIPTSAKGAANGVAELDSNGLVPTSQLPSYVDDVLEYANKASFPSTGETGKIYVDLATNLTYRWSGSAYIEISPSLALGTTSSTAFRGDYGQSAYTHAVTNKGSAFNSGLYKITTNSEGHVTAAIAVAASDIPDLSSMYSTTDEKLKTNEISIGDSMVLIGGTMTSTASTKSYANALQYTRFANNRVFLSLGTTSDNGIEGILRLFNNNGGYNGLRPNANITSEISVYLPSSSGTLALTSDIPTIPTNISAFTNDAGYITSYTETDPVFTASAAYGISSSDITNWNNKVSDDHKWNDVQLDKTNSLINQNVYIPFLAATTNTSALLIEAVQDTTGNSAAKKLAKYNNSGYLVSTTPTSGDNSTKVATTAFVQTALSSISLDGYIASDEIGKVYVSDTEPSTSNNYDIWIDTSTTLQNANGVMV